MRYALRSARSARSATLVAVPVALLLTGSSVAFADDGVARAETTSTGFGMLGPVGLVAVGLGIVGMMLGVLRQRRKARVAAPPAPVEKPQQVHADTEDPTRPLTPLRQP